MSKHIFFIFCLSAAVLSACCGETERWPDGTRVEHWFSEKPSETNWPEFNILDYGAKADSTILQTETIQKTIDAAAEKGGTVVIPEGVFLSGALFFKPGTGLRLEEGAVLKGSDDIEDYPDAVVHIEGVRQNYVSALVNAYGVDGFHISGPGTIDGNGLKYWTAFWNRRKENPDCTNLEVRRPRLIYVVESRDVCINGVRLKNPGFWTTHLYRCERVKIKDVKITAPISGVKAPSSDAIDIDGCRMVHIDHCDISVNDDFIALKGGKGPWADKDHDNSPDEKILIENCIFRKGPHVLTFGSECFDARNIIMRDCNIKNTKVLLRMKIRPDTPQQYRHVLLENITGYAGTLVHIKPWTQFFDLKDREDTPMSYVSDVTIRGSRINCGRLKNIDTPVELALIDSIRVENDTIFTINYDEKNVGDYTLEDPLTFQNGSKVTNKEQWTLRRKEIKDIFQQKMYGTFPKTSPIFLEKLEEGPCSEGGIRTQIRMWFRADKTGPNIDWLIIRPEGESPAPAIIALNYYGNHTIVSDPEVIVPDCWLDDSPAYCVSGNRASEAGRGLFTDGLQRTIYPIKYFVDNGYAFVTACYGDISPDPGDPALQKDLPFTGVFEMWGETDTRSLAAWAWGLSRGMDMIEELPELDKEKVILTGCSRVGKAALIAGAFDDRFPVVVPVQTGGGGVPLAKRNLGESIESETFCYSHWYVPEYSRYVTDSLDFDQHLLLSCIAPRKLLVEGFDNPWFDTYGEYLSVKAASPVWQFLDGEPLPECQWPSDYDCSCIGRDLGYVRRPGSHGISDFDWKCMLDFAGYNH